MSVLNIFADDAPNKATLTTDDPIEIASALAAVGVCFEQWSANQEIVEAASQEDVIAAYQQDIDRLMKQGGYQSVDVISLAADNSAIATQIAPRNILSSPLRTYQKYCN